MKQIIRYAFLLIIVTFSLNCHGQKVYKLWDGIEAPYYKENDLKEYEKENWGTMCLLNITEPTLTVYKAEGENTGKAVIIVPGGGYNVVAIHHEGYDIARALSKKGITAAVLKYRLPKVESSTHPHLVPLTDARRSLKMLRGMKDEYGFDSDKLGILGFSAGSHLSTVVSLWKSEDKRENPNFSVLIYGVTQMTDDNIQWLEESLYYRKMTQEELKENTLLEQVDQYSPPAFLVHAYDDEVCSVSESTGYARVLRKHDVPVEMHLFARGGHGFGYGRESDGTDQWVPLLINWIKSNSF